MTLPETSHQVKSYECTSSNLGHGRVLSNLHSYEFELDGYTMASMEGFLQSLKTNDPDESTILRSMSGVTAWKAGQKHTPRWQRTQTLYWDGKPYARQSAGYSQLISRAYDALSLNRDFRNNLMKSQDGELTHVIGHHDTSLTVLTMAEFLYNLYRVRSKLFEKYMTQIAEQ